MHLGYSLSSEEHGPRELVRHAAMAEEAGFELAMISDHYHPWTDRQGHSPFAWAVLGGIAEATSKIRVGTGVTAPIMRYHPALVAQTAATAAILFEGRFMLGLGTGEHLNEHILGDKWPPTRERQAMLEEAIAIIRELWEGGERSFEGEHYVVEQARVYDLPEHPPPILVAASGPESARLAGRAADGLVSVAPQNELVEAFRQAGGGGKPRMAQMTACWAPSEDEALSTVMEWWPNIGAPGGLNAELKRPADFEAVVQLVTPDMVRSSVALGPDAGAHVAMLRKYAEAGFDHVYVHQVGPDQQGMIDFYRREILAEAARLSVAA